MFKDKIKKFILNVVCFLVAIMAFGMIFNAETMFVFASVQEKQLLEQKYDTLMLRYNKVITLNEDFEDDKVIVILNSKHSKINGEIEISDFKTESNIEFVSVADEFIIKDKSKYLSNNKHFRQIITLRLKEKGKENVVKAINELRKLKNVLNAEPAYIYQTADNWIPNDKYFDKQWGISSSQGINVVGAWNISKGNSNVRIGLMEKNIQLDHPDLVGRVVFGNFTPLSTDDMSHGTHVAGIMSGLINNTVGISGIAQVSVYLLNRNDLASSLEWAENNNIKIINASYYYYTYVDGKKVPAGPSATHAQAIENYGGLFVASAGNAGGTNFENTDNTPQYPAGYCDERYYPNINNVISVGSIELDGTKSTFSNYGTRSVSLFAPGGNILSTFPSHVCTEERVTTYYGKEVLKCEVEYSAEENGYIQVSLHQDTGYHYMPGTSFAAPFVAGVAALMLSVNPNLTAQELKAGIMNNVDKVDALEGLCVSGGRLNAFKAVSSVAYDLTNVGDNKIRIDGLKTNLKSSITGELTIPEEINGRSVTQIGVNAFLGASLSKITVPSCVTEIGNCAFGSCENLTELTVESGNSVYMSQDNCIIRISDNTLIVGCKTSVIPSTVEKIGDSAFYGCSGLTGITIPGSVTSIGISAFYGCSGLSGTISLPSGVTSIAEYTFKNCSGITGMLSTALTQIGKGALENCTSLVAFAVPVGMTNIGVEAFKNCTSLNTLSIKSAQLSLGNYAFSGCNSLMSVVIPSGVTSMGVGVFDNCNYLTVYTSYGTAPTGWSSGSALLSNGWNIDSRPVFWGCSLRTVSGVPYVYSITLVAGSVNGGRIENADAVNGISAPSRVGYSFGGWYLNSSFVGTGLSATQIANLTSGTFYAKWTSGGTIVPILSDGEEIVSAEELEMILGIDSKEYFKEENY